MTTSVYQDQHQVSVLKPEGELDMYTAGNLKEAIIRVWEEGRSAFVIDLSRVSYLDSSGIGVLLYGFTGSQKRDVSIRFAGATNEVLGVLRMTKLDGFLPFSRSVEEASEALRGEVTEEQDQTVRGLEVDESSPLFDTSQMYQKTFYIDLGQVRRLSNLIAQQAPKEIREINMLEQQVSELIKNAVRHGNKNDKSKPVHIWFAFSTAKARVIVQDEGAGFENLEEWNAFYRKRIQCYREQDFDGMMHYLSFRTDESTENDGGNALFAAVEYWNDGVVFNEQRNAVAVQRTFRT